MTVIYIYIWKTSSRFFFLKQFFVEKFKFDQELFDQFEKMVEKMLLNAFQLYGHVKNETAYGFLRCMHRREYLQLLEGALSRKWCREHETLKLHVKTRR